jgi:hypothetical protein
MGVVQDALASGISPLVVSELGDPPHVETKKGSFL